MACILKRTMRIYKQVSYSADTPLSYTVSFGETAEACILKGMTQSRAGCFCQERLLKQDFNTVKSYKIPESIRNVRAVGEREKIFRKMVRGSAGKQRDIAKCWMSHIMEWDNEIEKTCKNSGDY